MKLKCFGDGECPEWVLSGLHAIGQLTAPRARALCMAIAEHLTGEPLQEQKIKSILSDVKLDSPDDMKMVISCLMFTLTSTARWGADGLQLDNGLRSAGVAWEVTRALRVAFDQHGAEIEAGLRKTSLRLTKLSSVNCQPAPEESIDCVELNMHIEDICRKSTVDHNFLIQQEDFKELLSELKKAKKHME